MVNSTAVTSGLAPAKLVRYYSIFLNATAAIAKNFGAKIIKNAGDCLIYYFPATSDSASQVAFSDVLECCTAMIDANRVINARLNIEGLPPLGYRISADYGKVEVARSATSNSDDLFGSTMNLCAKINSKAERNGMVVGADLHRVIQSIPAVVELYQFEQVGSYLVGVEQQKYAPSKSPRMRRASSSRSSSPKARRSLSARPSRSTSRRAASAPAAAMGERPRPQPRPTGSRSPAPAVLCRPHPAHPTSVDGGNRLQLLSRQQKAASPPPRPRPEKTARRSQRLRERAASG
jgi:hypothetical protein